MPYVERVTKAGNTIEIERYFTSRYKKKGISRGDKVKPTKEEQEKVNTRQAERKLRILINARWLLTLLINEALLAEDENAQLLEEKRVGRLIHAGNLQEVQNAIFKSFYRGTAGDNSDTENENDGEETTEEGNRAAVQEN